MTFIQTAMASTLILVGGLVASGAAEAQSPACGPRNEVVTRLLEQYGETRRSMALDRRGIVEVFASEETGSWTITITLPDGRTCLLAAGLHFTADPGTPAVGQTS